MVLESEVGAGSTFHCVLPFKAGSRSRIPAPPPETPTPALSSMSPLRILLVEDNRDNIKVVKALLGKLGQTDLHERRGRQAGPGEPGRTGLRPGAHGRGNAPHGRPGGHQAAARRGKAGKRNQQVPVAALTAPCRGRFQRYLPQGGNERLPEQAHFPGRTFRAPVQDVSDIEGGPAAQRAESRPDQHQVLDVQGALRRFEGDEELYQMVCADFQISLPEKRRKLAGGRRLRELRGGRPDGPFPQEQLRPDRGGQMHKDCGGADAGRPVRQP